MNAQKAQSGQSPGARRRLVSLDGLQERFGINYSRQHLYRRMLAGTFPKSIKLGPSKGARRMWVEEDITNWLDQQASEPQEADNV